MFWIPPLLSTSVLYPRPDHHPLSPKPLQWPTGLPASTPLLFYILFFSWQIQWFSTVWVIIISVCCSNSTPAVLQWLLWFSPCLPFLHSALSPRWHSSYYLDIPSLFHPRAFALADLSAWNTLPPGLWCLTPSLHQGLCSVSPAVSWPSGLFYLK